MKQHFQIPPKSEFLLGIHVYIIYMPIAARELTPQSPVYSPCSDDCGVVAVSAVRSTLYPKVMEGKLLDNESSTPHQVTLVVWMFGPTIMGGVSPELLPCQKTVHT